MNTQVKKPIPLRVIFILNALLIFLAFAIYYALSNDLFEPPGGKSLNPAWVLYTAIGYIITFIALVTCILNKKLMALRAVIITVALISIPAGGFIGILFSIISFALSFNKKVLAYFNQN